MILYTLDIVGRLDFGTFEVVGVMGEKEKNFKDSMMQSGLIC